MGALGLTSGRDPGTGARPLAASGRTRRPKPGASAPALTARGPHSSGEGLGPSAVTSARHARSRPYPSPSPPHRRAVTRRRARQQLRVETFPQPPHEGRRALNVGKQKRESLHRHSQERQAQPRPRKPVKASQRPPGTTHRRVVPPAGQVPKRSVAAYFFQGRSTRHGKSSRSGAGTCVIM